MTSHARVGKYLNETGVAQGFTNLLCGLIKHQPADPARWLVEETARIYGNEDREAEQEQERQRGAEHRPSARTLRRRRSKAKARALAGGGEQVQQVVQQEFPRKVQKGKRRSKGKEARRKFCSKRKAAGVRRAMVQAQKRAKRQCRRLAQYRARKWTNSGRRASLRPGLRFFSGHRGKGPKGAHFF